MKENLRQQEKNGKPSQSKDEATHAILTFAS